MAKIEYDATQEQWLHGDPGVLPGSVATAEQWHVKSTQVRESGPPRLSLIEWLIIGPIMVGLGFLMGVYWP